MPYTSSDATHERFIIYVGEGDLHIRRGVGEIGHAVGRKMGPVYQRQPRGGMTPFPAIVSHGRDIVCWCNVRKIYIETM